MEISKPCRRLVLAELPPADREKLLDFLLENQVDFVPDEESGNYVAKVVVLNPPARSPKRNDRVHARVASSAGTVQPASITGQATPNQATPRRGPAPAAAACRRAALAGGAGAGTAPGVQKARVSALLSVQADLSRRYRRFCGLLPPLARSPKAMQRTELFRLVEDLYAARFAQAAQRLRSEAAAAEAGEEAAEAGGGAGGACASPRGPAGEKQGFPHFVTAFLQKRFGLKQVVSQACWSLVSSADQLRGLHVGAELFARFLEESLDDLDLLFLLNTRSSMRQAMLTDKRRAANCSPWQRVWHAAALPTERRPPAAEAAGTGAASAPKEWLDAKQVVQVVRDAVTQKDLQERLLERFNDMMADFSMEGLEGGGLDVDRFLLTATEMFHGDRGEPVHEDLDPRVQELIQALLEHFGDSLEAAFHAMDIKRRGMVTYSEFARALKATTFAGDVQVAWHILDSDADGAISLEDFLGMQDLQSEEVHRRAKGTRDEGFRWSDWNPDLSPEVLQEADALERRLIDALAERGEASRARPEELRGWAINVALSRRERPPSRPPREASGPGEGPVTGYAVSPEEMQHAWWSFHGGASPSTSANLAPDAEISRGEDVEATVRSLLTRATEGLVSDALAASSPQGRPPPATGDLFAREALMCEFAPVMDALMEALVAGDVETWIRELGPGCSGDERQRGHFCACHEGLQEALTAPIRTSSVDRVCKAVAATPELRAAACARAEQLAAGSLGQGQVATSQEGSRALRKLGTDFLISASSKKLAGKAVAAEGTELPVLLETAEPDAELSQELPPEPLEIVSLEENAAEELPARAMEMVSLGEERVQEAQGPAAKAWQRAAFKVRSVQRLRSERKVVSSREAREEDEARRREEAATRIQAAQRRRSKQTVKLADRSMEDSSHSQDEARRREEAAAKIQAAQRRRSKQTVKRAEKPEEDEARRREEAALKIQAAQRRRSRQAVKLADMPVEDNETSEEEVRRQSAEDEQKKLEPVEQQEGGEEQREQERLEEERPAEEQRDQERPEEVLPQRKQESMEELEQQGREEEQQTGKESMALQEKEAEQNEQQRLEGDRQQATHALEELEPTRPEEEEEVRGEDEEDQTPGAEEEHAMKSEEEPPIPATATEFADLDAF